MFSIELSDDHLEVVMDALDVCAQGDENFELTYTSREVRSEIAKQLEKMAKEVTHG